MAEDKLVTIGEFANSGEAHLVKGQLESEGIECFLQDEQIVSMNWLYSNAVGGVKIQVRSSDAEEALEILNANPAEQADSDTISCPKCHSGDIFYEKVHRGPFLTAFFLFGAPFVVRKNTWKCQSCKHSWKRA